MGRIHCDTCKLIDGLNGNNGRVLLGDRLLLQFVLLRLEVFV